MELLRDKSVKERFEKLIKNSLARNPDYDMKKFIGGLPVTLERKDMSTINIKKPDGQSKYMVTQKVDGTRMLMYIAPSGDGGSSKIVCFIDRNMEIYIVRDSRQDNLPYINSREMLIDGEVVFFDKKGESHKELNPSLVKGVSFMAFDILYGPNDIDIKDEEKIIGQDSSMTVPESGGLRTQPWPYINRYDILYKLIVPSTVNNNEPILTSGFKGVEWFNVEIKPIYFLNEIKGERILYSQNGQGYLQHLLKTHRINFYKDINSKFKKNVTNFTSQVLKLDGLIFTSVDTLYTIGAWNKSGMVQYKWKPITEQTVDLQIKKLSNGEAELLFSGKNGSLQEYEKGRRPVRIRIPDNVKNGDIVELRINSQGDFVYKEIRPDKDRPNALRTVLNVLNSFNSPVDINDLHYFLNLGENSGADHIQKVLNYSTRTNLLRCISTSNKLEMLNENDKYKVQQQINKIGEIKDIEIEMRLGKIDRNFKPNISEDVFTQIIQAVDKYGLIKDVDDFVDVYSKELPGVRTRYIYSSDFQKFILLESIIKTRLENIDIEMSKVWEHDIRLSASTETKVQKYNIDGESYLKQRISYTDKNKAFRLDFTVISDGKFIDRNFIVNAGSKQTRQFEIELLKSDININELFVFITGLIRLD